MEQSRRFDHLFFFRSASEKRLVVVDDDQNEPGRRFWHVGHLLGSIFLPEGFPDSVSDDYVAYQLWDTAQVTHFIDRTGPLPPTFIANETETGSSWTSERCETFSSHRSQFNQSWTGIDSHFWRASFLDCVGNLTNPNATGSGVCEQPVGRPGHQSRAGGRRRRRQLVDATGRHPVVAHQGRHRHGGPHLVRLVQRVTSLTKPKRKVPNELETLEEIKFSARPACSTFRNLARPSSGTDVRPTRIAYNET